MPRVVIATPTSDFTVTSGFARSVFQLGKALTKSGVEVDMRTIRSADVELARNRFATRILQEPYTHILFVDEDMEFTPEDIVACLDFGKPIVGLACVRQELNLEDILSFLLARKLDVTPANIGVALSCTAAFNLELAVERSPETTVQSIQIVRGFVRVKRLGTGVMLVEKAALQRMIESGCVTLWKNRQADAAETYEGGVYGFFSKLDHQGRQLSEDYSFCHRWVAHCGGEIWAKVDSTVKHLGQHAFTGCYLDRLTRNRV